MNKYRIGRIAGSWINFTPPIRGGIYRADTEDNDQDVDTDTDVDNDNDTDWSSYPPSWNSSRTSLDLIEEQEATKPDENTTPTTNSRETLSPQRLRPSDKASEVRCRKASNTQEPDSSEMPPILSKPSLLLTSPEDYTSTILQEEIDNGVRDNPSLDAQTQRVIALKYQSLHERVKNEGFYDCQYAEYGKEMIRYTFLFACFIGCLRAEWYMTSAIFLGLFWVRNCLPTINPFLADLCCSNKSCSQPMMPVIEV